MGQKIELAGLLLTALAVKGAIDENLSRDLHQHAACESYAQTLVSRLLTEAPKTINLKTGEAVVIPYEFDTSSLSFLGRTWLMASDKLIDTLVEHPVQNAICDKSAYDIA
jgi:hypothetical protein